MIADEIRRAWEMVARHEFVEAWPVVTEVLNEEPEHPAALYLAGCVMRNQGNNGVALQLFRRALSLKKDIPNIWMHYGATLHDTHQYDEARECFKMVQKQLPNDPMPAANIAAGYIQQGKAREAVEWADKVLVMDPTHKIARIAKAFGCLALGRWRDGWTHIDALYEEKLITRIYTPAHEPPWDGSPGKTVVVQADQGLGDMVMFAQCLPEMARDCKKVIVETNERIAPLFKRCFPEIDVYGTLKTKGITWPRKYQIDAAMHLSHLGKYYRKQDADFPKRPYLTAHPKKEERWRAWLEQFPRPWVGIAWRGGIPETNTKARSIEVGEFAPIIRSGGTMVNLCYQNVGREIALWNVDNPEQIRVPPIDNEGDYEETVALIAALDRVVTVTTTVAHVCGALGKTASVLVNKVPQWRYAHGADHLLWYPDTLTLYRQKPGENDWSHTINRVARELQPLVLAA